MEIKTKYYCDICNTGYKTEEEAIKCENKEVMKEPCKVHDWILIHPRYEEPVWDEVIGLNQYEHGWIIFYKALLANV